MKIKGIVLFLLGLIFCNKALFAEEQKKISTEIRAVWLTTNWNLDWPNPRLSIENQQKQLCDILDSFREANFNTVFFQARIRGDVFYHSSIEPLSPFAKPGYDALAFAVEECHKRGLECHAWVVTFPVGTKKQVERHKGNSVVKKHPEICKLYNGEWYLDPGNPGTHTYLLRIVDEVVSNYDIDGIHFDYIRYPEKAAKFPDTDTFKKYGNGMSLNDWRRDNITKLVSSIYDEVKAKKPWVQVSSSPLGKYRELPHKRNGWTALESVFQDAALWMKLGKHDGVYPMMYYKEELFYPYVEDWMENNNRRFVVPGLGAYRMLKSEGDWALEDITKQIDFTREKEIDGQAYFRAANVLDNLKGLKTTLQKNYYPYPVKLPPMNWLDSIAPNSPIELMAHIDNEGKLNLQWQSADHTEVQTYTVYRSSEENIDRHNAANIIATGIRSNRLRLTIERGDFGRYYTVTASDRFHNESVICIPAFVVHSEEVK